MPASSCNTFPLPTALQPHWPSLSTFSMPCLHLPQGLCSCGSAAQNALDLGIQLSLNVWSPITYSQVTIFLLHPSLSALTVTTYFSCLFIDLSPRKSRTIIVFLVAISLVFGRVSVSSPINVYGSDKSTNRMCLCFPECGTAALSEQLDIMIQSPKAYVGANRGHSRAVHNHVLYHQFCAELSSCVDPQETVWSSCIAYVQVF